MDFDYDIDWVLEEYSDLFEQLQIEKLWARSFLNDYVKKHSNLKDGVWSLFNKSLTEIAGNTNDLYGLHNSQYLILSEMVFFRRKYDGTDDKKLVRNMWDQYLESKKYNTFGYEMEIKIIANRGCSYGRSIDNTVVTIDEAIEKKYLGSEKCTKNWCTCCYSEQPKRDANGEMIRLK